MSRGPSAPDPPSPCRRICRLEGALCLGCGRLLDEIAAWPTATPAARWTILQAAASRVSPGTGEAAPPRARRKKG